MRALTIRQPWAQLITLGVKWIETRSWATKYRGPVLVHTGKHKPTEREVGRWYVSGAWGGWRIEHQLSDVRPGYSFDLPLGCVVAVADLVDCVPIIDRGFPAPGTGRRLAVTDDSLRFTKSMYSSEADGDVSDQRPFGDFTPGRYGWLLDNVRPLSSPVPAKGRQGLWRPDDALVDAVMEATK